MDRGCYTDVFPSPSTECKVDKSEKRLSVTWNGPMVWEIGRKVPGPSLGQLWSEDRRPDQNSVVNVGPRLNLEGCGKGMYKEVPVLHRLDREGGCSSLGTERGGECCEKHMGLPWDCVHLSYLL